MRLFAIERLLELPEGTYSRFLGYVPADTIRTVTVAEAIAGDPELDPVESAALLAHYETVITLKRQRRRQALVARPDPDEGVEGSDDPLLEAGGVVAGRGGRKRR